VYRGTVTELVESVGQKVADVWARVARAHDEVGRHQLGESAAGSIRARVIARHHREGAIDPHLFGVEALLGQRAQLKRDVELVCQQRCGVIAGRSLDQIDRNSGMLSAPSDQQLTHEPRSNRRRDANPDPPDGSFACGLRVRYCDV
jgi:hypothetical protein